MELYIVRHGETDGNVNKIMDGIRDIPINKNGEKQALIAREQLKDVKFNLIICSPLTRTKQTMNIINIHNYPVIYEPQIMERDCGEFMGKSFDSLDRDLYWNYLDETKYEKAENIKDFFKRIYNFIDYIKEKYSDKTILLVTHGGVSKVIHCYFNGIPENGNLRHIGLSNCEIIKHTL